MKNLIPGVAGALGLRRWTPAQIPGLLFWLQAPQVGRTDNLTIVGGKVSAAADAGGGATVLSQGTAARRPVFNTADFTDGYTSIVFDYSDDTELASATGGLTGDNALTMVTIGALTGTPAFQASNQGMMQFGPAAPGNSNVLGVNNTGANGEFWGGGGPATGTPGGGALISNAIELVHKTYSPAPLATVYRNGVQVCSGAVALPTTDATLLMGSTFGAAAFANPDYRCLTRLFISGVISASNLTKLYRWAQRVYPTAFPATYGFIGDSNTSGSGAVGPTQTYGYLLCQDRAKWQWQSATTGWTTADALAALPAFLATAGMQNVQMVSIMLGTNDVNTGVATATTLANYAAIVAAIRAALPSAAIVLSQVLNSTVFNTQAKLDAQAAINAWINANASNLWLANPCQNYPGIADPTGPGFQGDGVHLSVAGQVLFKTCLAATYPGS